MLSERVKVKTINQRYSSCIFLTTVPNFTSTEEPNYQLQFTVYCIANWYQVTACLDDSSRWIWNASLGIGLIIFRLRVGMGGRGEGRSEDFNYISIKLTRPLPPPPRLCIILMTPPMGSSFFVVPLLYSINDDWSPLRFPHDKKWPNLLTFQACTQCFKRCCMAQPCFNGGTCRENCHVTGRRFLCNCPARFIGNVCEKGMLLM